MLHEGKSTLNITIEKPLGCSNGNSGEDVSSIATFIHNALEMKCFGNSVNYDYVVSNIQSPADADCSRRLYLAMTHCITAITAQPDVFYQLLHVLFKFNWLSEPAVVQSFAHFLTHVVSANSTFILPALQMLVRNLVPPFRAQTNNGVPVPAEVYEKKYEYIHDTLRKILVIAPSGCNLLFSVLSEHFPHKRVDALVQKVFLRNLTHVADTVPVLRYRILGLIVEKLVDVDVEIKLDETEEDMFTMEDFLDDAPEIQTEDEMSEKLDLMMLQAFEYIDKLLESNVKGVSSALNDTFRQVILHTYRSKHPQFLLFYVCKLYPPAQDTLIQQLTTAMLDAQTPFVTRHSCTCYLASFLARAKFVTKEVVKFVLYDMMHFIHEQLDKGPKFVRESTSTQSLLGCVLQAACYVICFRGLEIAETREGRIFLRELDWERVCTSDLGLFDNCCLSVSSEFFNMAGIVRLASEEAIEMAETGAPYDEGSSRRTLEMPVERYGNKRVNVFFPFDPYLLRRSFRFIGPDYIYWKHVDPHAEVNGELVSRVRAEAEQEEEEDGEGSDMDVSMVSPSLEQVGSWQKRMELMGKPSVHVALDEQDVDGF